MGDSNEEEEYDLQNYLQDLEAGMVSQEHYSCLKKAPKPCILLHPGTPQTAALAGSKAAEHLCCNPAQPSREVRKGLGRERTHLEMHKLPPSSVPPTPFLKNPCKSQILNMLQMNKTCNTAWGMVRKHVLS